MGRKAGPSHQDDQKKQIVIGSGENLIAKSNQNCYGSQVDEEDKEMVDRVKDDPDFEERLRIVRSIEKVTEPCSERLYHGIPREHMHPDVAKATNDEHDKFIEQSLNEFLLPGTKAMKMKLMGRISHQGDKWYRQRDEADSEGLPMIKDAIHKLEFVSSVLANYVFNMPFDNPHVEAQWQTYLEEEKRERENRRKNGGPDPN